MSLKLDWVFLPIKTRIMKKFKDFIFFRTKRMVLVVIFFSILYNISRFFEYKHEKVASWQDGVKIQNILVYQFPKKEMINPYICQIKTLFNRKKSR